MKKGYGKKGRKLLDLGKQWGDAKAYLRESYWYIFAAFMIFFVSGFIGFYFAEQFSFIDLLLAEIIGKTEGLNSLELVFFILQNNLQSAFFGFLWGIIFGIFPIITALLNGIVLGYVAERVGTEVGYFSLVNLLPHGIFELPAIFIALGLGIKLGFSIFVMKNKGAEFKRRFLESVNVFLVVVVPLLIIAAVIEGILIGLLR
jgi:stage II sporulation protein M